MRVLLFLMHGEFSLECLKNLATCDIELCGLVTPKSSTLTKKEIPVYTRKPVLDIAEERGIPVTEINDTKNAALAKTIARQNPDYILVACFPFLIPHTLRTLATHGAYNLHPSMLPDYKGPTPLFWQFYFGEPNTGVTLHEMTDELDAGPIVFQQQVDFQDGIGSAEASILLAQEGSRLVRKHLDKLMNHQAVETRANLGGRYFNWPARKDFTLDTHWEARRVFNFIKGTCHWNQPYRLYLGNAEVLIRDAISYSPSQYAQQTVVIGNRLGINFRGGSILADLL